MTGVDIRWQQRFGNFCQALARLREATVLEIVAAVVTSYLGAFEELKSRLQSQESLP